MSNLLKCARRASVSVFAGSLLSVALLASSGSAATAQTSVSAARMQAVETCAARARRQTSSGTNRMRRRELLYASCMPSKGQRP